MDNENENEPKNKSTEETSSIFYNLIKFYL